MEVVEYHYMSLSGTTWNIGGEDLVLVLVALECPVMFQSQAVVGIASFYPCTF